VQSDRFGSLPVERIRPGRTPLSSSLHVDSGLVDGVEAEGFSFERE